MKLNDLALRLSEKEGISAYKAKKVINSMFDIITDAVSNGEVVYLRRLGTISLRCRYWRRVWRTGNKLFHRKESQEGYSLLPHIKLSERFKRGCAK